MGKICKSCGNYYSGEYCDKCGYGKKVGISKAAKKYRRSRKPERFRTEEDKKLYAKWEREERRENAGRTADPGANRNFLITILLVAVGVVFVALYRSGAIFSNTRTELVEGYFTSIEKGDFKGFVKSFPKEIKYDYERDMKDSGLGEAEYMQALYKDFEDKYGAGYTITVEFGNETELGAEDYDMSDYKAMYGTAPSLKEVYEMVVNITFSGHKGSEQAKLYMYVGKTGGYWRIFGISEDVGTMTGEEILESARNENAPAA
ncbi:MAG: hypothetical protein IJ806_03460 [Ruminococcus sp.]|nr:hypothetical protein [Ruminococcus sp.]